MAINDDRVIRLTETGSTNADALRLALSGEALPLWVLADRQTAGRGRSGRTWISEQGNLHASLAVHCRAPIAKAGELAFVAGVAMYDAIRCASGLAANTGLRLKWPNDLLVGTFKVGGILVETTQVRAATGFVAVMGFGLNVASVPQGLDRQAAALSQFDAAIDVGRIEQSLRQEMIDALNQWDAGRGFERIRRAWLERAGPLGEAVSVHTTSGLRHGTYQGMTATGALLARIGDDLVEINYGDVSLASDAESGGQG